jgi:hypothetical protein
MSKLLELNTQQVSYADKLLFKAIETIEIYDPLTADNQDTMRLWLAAKLVLNEYKMEKQLTIERAVK